MSQCASIQVVTSPFAEFDKAVAQPQRGVAPGNGGLDVKGGAGAHLAGKAQIVAPLEAAALHRLGKADAAHQVRLGLIQPVEVKGDREMLGDVAFPGRDATAIGFDPSSRGRGGHVRCSQAAPRVRRSGKRERSPSREAGQMPRSVTSPVTSRAGVTSKA